MKKNIKHLFISLLVSVVALSGMTFTRQASADEGVNASFAITASTPKECSPETATAVSITGTGFSSGLAAGIALTGSVIATSSQLTDIGAVYSSSTSMTGIVPTGLSHGEYDLYVYDPAAATFTYAKKEEAVEVEVETDNDTTIVTESTRMSARKKVWVTFDGFNRTDTKKRWMKVRMNGKNVPITKLRWTDQNTMQIQLNIKYRNWDPATYDLTLTVKEKQQISNGQTRKGKNKYRYQWATEVYAVSDILTVLAAS